MNEYMGWIWLGAMVFFLIVEAITPQLVSLWFAGGALLALVLSLFDAPVLWQLVVFVAGSVLLLVLTRPFVKNVLKFKRTSTNVDKLVGREALVTEAIDNLKGEGLVKIAGVTWSARSESPESIPEGETVVVCRIEGVRAVVRPAASE